MAMGLYLEARINQPLSMDVMEEVAQLAENQTDHRNFVLLCHRLSTAHRSLHSMARTQ